MKKALVAFLFILVLSVQAIFSQAPAPASPKWTVDDVIMGEQAGGFQISPDGKWVVWVKNAGDKDKNQRVSNIMLASLTEQKEMQLTRGSDSSFNPQWSPDGQTIAFISTRPNPKAKDKPSDGEQEMFTGGQSARPSPRFMGWRGGDQSAPQPLHPLPKRFDVR